MKRETKRWLSHIPEWTPSSVAIAKRLAQDALDSDARQKAEIRRKDRALQIAKEQLEVCGHSAERCDYCREAYEIVTAALKSKPHVCVTTSGDEQVTCDDKRCPRKGKS